MEEKKIIFPPALLVANIAAIIGMALSFTEIFPENSGKTLGFIPSSLAWPLLIASGMVACICCVKYAKIIKLANDKK